MKKGNGCTMKRSELQRWMKRYHVTSKIVGGVIVLSIFSFVAGKIHAASERKKESAKSLETQEYNQSQETDQTQ